MRAATRFLMAALVTVVVTGYPPQTANGQSSVRCSGGYFQLETLFLDRTNSATSRTLVQNNFLGTAALNSEQLDFDMNGGARATLGLTMANCQSLELSYFGLQDWDETKVLLGNNNLSLPGNVGAAVRNFQDADRVQVDYSADIDNAEFNLVANNCALGLLAGVRYLSFNEFLRMNAFDAVTGTSDYITHTVNDMYGGQIGLRFEHCLGRARVSATAKGGLFRNDASQQQNIYDVATGLNYRNSRSEADEFGLVGDVSLNTSYYLTHQASIRAGYNVLWVEGVALAPEQVDFSGAGTGLDTDGSAFFHGFHLGIEFRR